MSTQFGHRCVGIDRFTRLHLADALSERFMEGGTFVLVHVVGIRPDKLNLFALGQVSGLV
jgi:hypothetical protein